MAVVIVPILDYMTGKKMTRDQLIGLATAVAGVALLELGGTDNVSWSLNDLATFVQPLGFGFAFWRTETAMRQYPAEAKRITAAQMIPVFVFSALYCVLVEAGISSGTPTIDMATVQTQLQTWLSDPTIMAALLWTGVITTAVTVYMENLALKTLSAAETTLIFSTEPIWGAAFATVVVQEHLGSGAALGAALVVAGCIYSNVGLEGLRQAKAVVGIPAGLMAGLPAAWQVAAVKTQESVGAVQEAVEEISQSVSESL